MLKFKKVSFILLFASFVEGGALMGVELLSSKIIAPFYGTSLYVWAAVLGFTMGGLALGYFIGGQISSKENVSVKTLVFLFFLSAFFVWLMPFSAKWIMENTLSFNLRLGIILSCSFFMLPPIICFGMVSPIIIRLLIKSQERIGFSAGLVYSISTLGGIASTFLTGFFLISNLGIKLSVNLAGLYLMMIPAVFILWQLLIGLKEKTKND
jgi:predicted membrane-bound spermidine synthase